jgi:hypothetical protein
VTFRFRALDEIQPGSILKASFFSFLPPDTIKLSICNFLIPSGAKMLHFRMHALIPGPGSRKATEILR